MSGGDAPAPAGAGVGGAHPPTEAEVADLVLRMLRIGAPPAGELARANIVEWDSLKHMEIVFALEDRYGVRFDEAEFQMLVTPAAIAAALRRHLAA